MSDFELMLRAAGWGAAAFGLVLLAAVIAMQFATIFY
jgi:hypothetical protein